jgi:hypothetical protein
MSNGVGTQYTFLPYLRRGLSAYFVAPPGATPSQSIPGRVQLNVQLAVSAFDVNNNPLPGIAPPPSQTVSLYGPGDVIGFNPNHVVKTDPANLTSSFEPDYFPSIEFDQPDFPWLFSPMSVPDVSQNQQLLPWIVLIVLADGEYTQTQVSSGPSYIDVADSSVLPNLQSSWCWAHTQLVGGAVSGDLGPQLASSPASFISRLLCLRHLAPDVHYTGFVVPAFDAGVAAGLGQPPSTATTLGFAWTGTGPVRLPYYYGGKGTFEFVTSSAGDFETLVRLLKPQASPPSVGTRPMSVADAGANWLAHPNPSAASMQLGGALQSDLTVPPWTDGAAFQTDLGTLLTSTAAESPQTSSSGDPKIGPPFYGRWYTGMTSVAPGETGWVPQCNLDPRNRAVAGYGVYIVLKERNQLMRAAWQQLQYVQQANRTLRALQMSRGAMRELYQANLVAADAPTLIAWTQTVQSRVLMNGATVSSTIAASGLPRRLISAAGRRLLRPYGPLRHRGPTTATPYNLLSPISAGTLPLVPPVDPQGSISYTGELNGLLPPWLPPWLQPLLPYLPWILLALALLSVLVLWLIAGLIAAGAALLVLAALLAWLWPQITQLTQLGEVVTGTEPQNLNAGTFTNAAPQPNYGVVQFGTPPTVPSGPAGAPGTDSAAAAAFRSAAASLVSTVQGTLGVSVTRTALSFGDTQSALLTGLNPEVTLPARGNMLVQLGPSLNWPRVSMDPLEPVLAYPRFDQPMYVPLRDWSQEILMPGISAVPENSMTLLEENHAFIEAYMLGLNVEMGRQLLWNGFPTDQRGSYFRQFWDISGVYPQPNTAAQREALYDIPTIDSWPSSNTLGSNVQSGQRASTVLLLRGQLLLRYPWTHIYACPAEMVNGQLELAGGGTDPSQQVLPVYRGALQPDVTFLGFPLSEPTLLAGGPYNQGYFIVFEQQSAGEHRFGLEPASGMVTVVTAWSQLSWGNFPAPIPGTVQYADPSQTPSGLGTLTGADASNAWDRDAGQTAYVTFRPPARVAVLAGLMLNPNSA